MIHPRRRMSFLPRSASAMSPEGLSFKSPPYCNEPKWTWQGTDDFLGPVCCGPGVRIDSFPVVAKRKALSFCQQLERHKQSQAGLNPQAWRHPDLDPDG